MLSPKTLHAALIITFLWCSTRPTSSSAISDLHHNSATLNLEVKNLQPHKSLGLMLLHTVQFGSQVIIYDLFSLGKALLLCNSFLRNKQTARQAVAS